MLPNIREHSRVVCRVSLQLADWLEDVDIRLDRHALEIGALLHDIAKTPCLGTSRRHDIEGAKLLLALGYPELAYLVSVHVRLPDPHPVDESFVVYYADKRVKHDEVVDLVQRFSYIAERYGKGDGELLALIDKGRHRAMAAERELFALLEDHRTPEGLGACVHP
jgi:putative nucleotidyltransferase with HDIG domain